jgi:hypothetical protein
VGCNANKEEEEEEESIYICDWPNFRSNLNIMDEYY